MDAAKDPASTAVYDVMGFKLSSTDANGHKTVYTPDNWERVTDVQAPDLTHTSTIYDVDGNITSVTDANSHTVKNEYDADDRLTKTTNGRTDVVTYAYDGTDHITGAPQRGLLSSKTDGNQHTTYYTYTVRNEPLATYYADGTSESVGYDNNGNTTSRIKPDGTSIGYTYDNANHLTDITYPHLPATHFYYDAAGRKVHMSDGTGDTYWSYLYDGVHLDKEANIQGTVSYLYDGDGRRSQMTLAGQSAPWVYGYDLNGRLSTLQSPTDGKTTYTYDGAGGPGTKDANGYTQYGLLSRKTKGSGEFDTYTYDVCNEVLTIGYNWADGTYHDGLVYGYDPAGNVKTKSENGTTTTYGYDGADQLTSELIGGTTYAYTFDGNGNRLTQTANGAAFQSFTYDAHDKTVGGTQGNETDTWDANGNEKTVSINGGLYSFTYDDEDRLTKLVTPTATDTYTYNGLGLRVAKTDSTGSYSYATDGASPGASVLADGHALYTPGLSENRNGTSVFYSSDKLGNLWTADGTGKQQFSAVDYSAFGLTLTGTSGTPFGYGGANGCQTDMDASLVLMGHRYFDPRTGRFISKDPVGAGRNWYVYAENNPTNDIDPSGLTPMDGPGSSPMGSPGYMDGAASGSAGSMEEFGMNWQRHAYNMGGYDTPGVTHVFIGYYWTPGISMAAAAPGMGLFGRGYSALVKESRMWVNYSRFRTQGAARAGIAANLVFIVGGISYMGSPASGGVGSNALVGGGGVLSIISGIGTTAAGADMAIGGTAAATLYGGAACATGVGAIIVGGAVVGVAGYRASDAWVNTTPSGQAFTDALGSATYSAGKFLGVYNFILPFDIWKKIGGGQTHNFRRMRHHLPTHHSLLHHHPEN